VRDALAELRVPNVLTNAIVEYKGLLWVPHKDLIEGGYGWLESFTVVQINKRYYELQGHVQVTGYDGTDVEGGCWWIEEIDPEEYFADVPVLGPDADGNDG
jgi:hypothetical protein